eukprot:COSAG02_NODE_8597_length_2510_cov_1.579428_2_plen_454_part_00
MPPAEEPGKDRQCRCSVLLLCVLTEMTALMHSGIVFGWAPMSLTLQREGWFDDGCSSSESGSGSDDSSTGGCASQTAKLTQIYSVGTVVYGASGVVLGALIDRFGPRFGVGLAGCFTCSGLYLFGCFVHDGKISPVMIFNDLDPGKTLLPLVGFVLLALGGMCFFLTSFKMVPLLPVHRQGLAAAGLTTLGDASCAIFLVFNLLNSVGVPLWTISMAYMCVTAAMTLALLALWSLVLRQKQTESESVAEPPTRSTSPRPLSERAGMLAMARSISAPGPTGADTLKKTIMGVVWEKHLERKYGARFLAKVRDNPSATGSVQHVALPTEYQPLSERDSVVSQLCSLEFGFILLFSMIFFTRASLYLGLLGEFLSSPAFSARYDAVTQAQYVNILSAIVPLGCLFAPVIDPAIQRLGFLSYAIWVALCAVAYSLCMLVPSMPMQLLGCLIFTYFRA